MSEPAGAWIDAIRAALPSVPLHALGDHGSELSRDLGVEVIPGVEGSVAERISKMRLMVSPLRHHPFETGPIEAAAVGPRSSAGGEKQPGVTLPVARS